MARDILTDENGVPFVWPDLEDFSSLAEYAAAVHDFNTRVNTYANRCFDETFRRTLKAEPRKR